MSTFLKSALSLPAAALQMIFGLTAGLSVYAATVATFGSGSLVTVIMLIPMSLGFAFVSTFIHETGHAFAAAQSKWIIDRIVVWPVVYRRRTKKWSIEIDLPGDGDIFGWVETHPVGTGGSRRQETYIHVGGGVANLLAAAVCLLLAQVVAWPPFSSVLGWFAIFSIVDACFNLIPWRVRGRANDGLKVWRLWRREKPRRKVKSQWNVPRKW
jgi:hypothetical protein